MFSRNRVAAIWSAVAAALIAVGLVVGGPSSEIEGVYFNSSVGADGSAISQVEPGLLDLEDGNLWIGAGFGVALATLGTWAIGRRYATRPPTG